MRALAALPFLAACAAPASPPSSPLPLPASSAPPPLELDGGSRADTPEAQARAFVAAVAARRFDVAAQRFDAPMAEAMSTAGLADLWRKLEDAGGPFQSIEAIETDVEGEYRVARVTCRFAHLRKVLRIVVGADDRIVGLFFGPVPKEIEDSARAVAAPVDVPGGSVEEGKYFLSLRGYQPTDVAAKLAMPILVLQGSRDYQVTMPDLDGWKRALGGLPNVEIDSMAGLNHLFIAGTGAPGPAEYETPGHVDLAVIDSLARFVGRLPTGAGP